MKAVVIFSGGQDSTTILHWALKKYSEVEAITFNYGQKHVIEVDQSKKICKKNNVKQTIVDISFLGTLVDSALTSNGDVNVKHPRLKDLPASFVPNRNQLFITLAHAYAQKIGADILVTGVCQTDYSGYPDCRLDFILAIEEATNLGSDANIRIKTPLMFLNKQQTFELAEEVGAIDDVINLSHTCYNGDRKVFNEWGYGCGECPACVIRKNGFNEYKEVPF